MQNLRHFWASALGGLVLLETSETEPGANVYCRSTDVRDDAVRLVVFSAATPALALGRVKERSCNPVGFTPDQAVTFARIALGWMDEVVAHDGPVAHAPVPQALPDLDEVRRPPAFGEKPPRPAHVPEWLDIPPGSEIAPPPAQTAPQIPSWMGDPSKPQTGAFAHAQSVQSAAQTAPSSDIPFVPAESLPVEVRAALEAQRRQLEAVAELAPGAELVTDAPAPITLPAPQDETHTDAGETERSAREDGG